MIKKLRLTEKSNFDNITKAADYYYPRWESEVMDTSQIRDELTRLGHSEDFIDATVELIFDKYDDNQRYWDEYDESFSNGGTIRESVAEKDLYDDLYSYADQYRMTSRWTKANVEKYLERQKNFRRMSDADFQKVVDKVNKDFKRKKKVKSFPYDSNSYKTESIRRKRLKEDSWDDFVKPNIEKRYIWPLYEDSAYEITEIIKKYQNSNRFKDEIKSFDFKDIEYRDWPALQLELVCSNEAYVLIRKDIEREGLYMDDDEFDESLKLKSYRNEQLSVKDAKIITSSDKAMNNLDAISKIRRNWNSFTEYEKKAHEKDIKRYVDEINDEIKSSKEKKESYLRYKKS